MSDYIKKQEVLDLIESAAGWSWSLNTIYDEIQAISADDVRPVVRGEWISSIGYYECSSCGNLFTTDHNFCPNCGRDMRGKEKL